MKKLYIFLAVAFLAPAFAFAATNLITNPTVDTNSTGWTQNHDVRNTSTFLLAATGQSGKGLQVKVTTYKGGDDGWYFADVPVTVGKTYTYTDYYQSGTAKSYLSIRYKLANGTFSFLPIVALAPSAAWTQSSVTLTPPTNAVSVTVLHALESVGTLTTDTFSLVDSTPVPVTGNLIKNPTFAATTTLAGGAIFPQNWQTGSWGQAAGAEFGYPAVGVDDNFAARVTLASYPGTGGGAAEWYHDVVTVVPGTLYTFSDSYQANTTTYLFAQWTFTDGTQRFDQVATLSPTNGAWVASKAYFTAPQGAKNIVILHTIQSVGTLYVDNYSLMPGTPPAGSALAKGIVSLTFDDGLNTQYDNALPLLSAANIPASFYIITNFMADNAYDIFTDPGEEISTSKTNTTTTWSEIYTDPTEQHYRFTDTYTASSQSTLKIQYKQGTQTKTITLGTLPAGANKHASFAFTLPTASGSTVTPITIVQSVTSGTLTTSNTSMVPLGSGFLGPQQVKDLQTLGFEVGDHTKTHPDLTTLSVADATTEISGARQALVALGITPATTFAYPVGGYNNTVEGLVHAAGMTAARTIDVGYNGKGGDALALKSESMLTTTTYAEVKSWIDTAVANKLWLTITLHNIDSVANLNAIGDPYGTTPQILQQIISYLQTQQASGNVLVKSVKDALPLAQ